MSRFDWNKELINNTIENEIKKQTLMHEINNQRDEAMHSIYDMEFTKEQFRNLFRSELTKLSKISEPMTEFTFDLYSKVNPSELFIPVFEEQHISDDELVSYVSDFYHSLKDKEITKEVDEIINPDNCYLKIGTSGINDISNIVQGRVIKDEYSKLAYGSFYKKNDKEDMIILAHEIGHMLSHRLFGNDINPIMKKFLTEVESYYMELLCGSYLGITLQEPILEASYREDRLRKTINEAWNIHAQYLMFCHYINSNSKVLGNILNEDGYPLEVTDDIMKRFKKMSLLNNARRVNSYFIALELFKLTQQDPDKGINTYKKLFTSNIDNYNKLLKKFKMNYIEDTSSFDQMIEEAKTLKRVLLKDNN